MILTGPEIREAREPFGWFGSALTREAFLSLAIVEVLEEHGSALPMRTADDTSNLI